MIECTSEYVWKKRRYKKRFLWRFVLIVFLIIAILGFVYNKYVVAENLAQICSEYTASMGAKAINDAVLSCVEDTLYNDFISIEKNNNGDISMISANSNKINKISREIVNKTEQNMSGIIKNGVPIPVLAFTGIGIVSGYGRVVNYKSVTISKINCNFSSTFNSAGVNQTIHSIYAEVIIDVDINFQFETISDKVASSILICESIIVGEVPDTFLNGKLFN